MGNAPDGNYLVTGAQLRELKYVIPDRVYNKILERELDLDCMSHDDNINTWIEVI